ncbi:beta-ribofuranosylaminobenzene 5'-phosphate synthase family protein [Dethiosulfatarculus sandiegensis]|uniref:beta-ribofuranosylaminobenzene 5'-phosphate synthase family protein n=1 Tax=Dethiosulfatarculus sandiegensis TaxID=1429043 RepID=UPI0005C973EB|nr:beta-ribofuranosylaminobenzene 5'-phosphate synthase family protein [Dethiosulfatarculus sandiegensis]
MLNKEIRLRSISRLHFGFLDLNGDLGRKYGSLGLALTNPAYTLSLKPHHDLKVVNGPKRRTVACLEGLARHFRQKPLFKVEFSEEIPSHTGLGSGTQLHLALAKTATTMWGLNLDIKELASLVSRGRRSGVGVFAFDQGGFILDAGHNTDCLNKGQPPLMLMRLEFPTDWCFVLAIPQELKGLSGSKENETLATLKPSRMISQDICRFTVMKLLPSLIERDIKEFGCALTEIDRRTGMFFQAAQDGIYSESGAEDIVGYMLQAGAYGAGQSSWGPAIYGLSTQDEAPMVAKRVTEFFSKKLISGKVFIAQPDNRGVQMDFLDFKSNQF